MLLEESVFKNENNVDFRNYFFIHLTKLDYNIESYIQYPFLKVNFKFLLSNTFQELGRF